MRTKQVLIGIDIGSTNIKSVALSAEGRTLCSFKSPSAPVYQFHQMDGQKLWEALAALLQQTMTWINNQGSSYIVAGIGSAAVGCASILLDSGGRQVYWPPLKPLVNYMPEVDEEEFFHRTGYPKDYRNTGPQLAALAQQRPEILERVNSVLSIADYINFRLCGEKMREYSTVGSMSMLNKQQRIWWNHYLSVSGINPAILGEIGESGTCIGTVTGEASERTGLPKGTPVAMGGHDYLCAAFASGCVGPGRLLNVLGTYEMAASFYEALPLKGKDSAVRTFVDCHVVPGRFSYTSEVISARHTEWLRRQVFSGEGGIGGEAWSRLFAALDALPPSFEREDAGGIFVPHLYGSSFPHNIPWARGGFLGVSAAADQKALLRMVIEGLCFMSKGMLSHHCQRLNNECPEIIVVGGGSRSPFWIQTKADILGKPLTVPHLEEATATGAALLAGVGAGTYKDYEEAVKQMAHVPQDYYNPNQKRNALFEEIYRRVYLPAEAFLLKTDQEIYAIINENQEEK